MNHSADVVEAVEELADFSERALYRNPRMQRVIDKIISALSQESWRPTHRHVKRGSNYQVIGTASLQAAEPVGEAASLVVYRGENGRLWVRPEVEFDDGRFEAIPPIQTGEKP